MIRLIKRLRDFLKVLYEMMRKIKCRKKKVQNNKLKNYWNAFNLGAILKRAKHFYCVHSWNT